MKKTATMMEKEVRKVREAEVAKETRRPRVVEPNRRKETKVAIEVPRGAASRMAEVAAPTAKVLPPPVATRNSIGDATRAKKTAEIKSTTAIEKCLPAASPATTPTATIETIEATGSGNGATTGTEISVGTNRRRR